MLIKLADSWCQGKIWGQEGTVEGLRESPALFWWFHGPGSGVAPVLKEKEHNEPMVGWNVVLLQPFGSLLR